MAFAATVGLAGQQYRAQGWVQVPQGQCVLVGNFQRATVWWHARDPKGIQWGDKPVVDLCVNLQSGFDYTWDGSGRSCNQNEVIASFLRVDVPAGDDLHTLNLN